MAGERTTAGSALFAASAPKEKDAPIVANLAAAGMVASGQDQSLGIRFFRARAQSAFRHAEKSARPDDAAHRRRLLVGRGGRGRRRPCALRDRQRHRRLDPRARKFLRHCRLQDQRGADRQAGRVSALTHARYDRPAGAHGRGLRADRHGAARPVDHVRPPARSRAASSSSCRTRPGSTTPSLQSRPISKPPLKRLAGGGRQGHVAANPPDRRDARALRAIWFARRDRGLCRTPCDL